MVGERNMYTCLVCARRLRGSRARGRDIGILRVFSSRRRCAWRALQHSHQLQFRKMRSCFNRELEASVELQYSRRTREI